MGYIRCGSGGGSGLELLGTSRTYDLSSRADYRSLTEDNFLCVCDTDTQSYTYGIQTSGTWDIGARGIFTAPTVNYNASTGVLTIGGGTITGYSTRNGNNYTGNSATLTVKTYLI